MIRILCIEPQNDLLSQFKSQLTQKIKHSRKQQLTANVWKEGEWFVAQCLEVDGASQGETKAKALDNLREALELHFEPPSATIAPQLQKIEVEVGRLNLNPIESLNAN